MIMKSIQIEPFYIAEFLVKLYEMVDDPSNNSVISWGADGNSFIISNEFELTKLIPFHFTIVYFASFRHQLFNNGFKIIGSPIEEGSTKIYSGSWEFAKDGFIQGQSVMQKIITRKRREIKNVKRTNVEAKKDTTIALNMKIGSLANKRKKKTMQEFHKEEIKMEQEEYSAADALLSLGEQFKCKGNENVILPQTPLLLIQESQEEEVKMDQREKSAIDVSLCLQEQFKGKGNENVILPQTPWLLIQESQEEELEMDKRGKYRQ